MSWNTKSFEMISKHVASYLGGIKEAQCSFHGRDWKYLDAGSGEVVLCVHGMGSSKTQWRSFMTGLSKEYRIICPDFPALSLRLGMPKEDFSKHDMYNWMETFLDINGLNQVNIIGHGGGGLTASLFTYQHSDRVNSLAWFNPPDLDAIRSGNLLAWERVKLGFETVEQAEEHLASYFYQPPEFPEIVKRFYLQRIMKAINEGELIPQFDRLSKSFPMFLSQISNIQQDSLVVFADHDVLSSKEWALKLTNAIPNSKLVTLERCGQRSLNEKPEELANIYRDFLQS